MPQNWSIKIEGAPAKFNPDVYGAEPGSPLQAQSGDLVSWNNQTADPHEIWVNDTTGSTQITDRIEKYQSSFPAYVTPQSTSSTEQTIDYYCSLHENEQGRIVVVS